MNIEQAVNIGRSALANGRSIDDVLDSGLIPDELHQEVKKRLDLERTVRFVPVRTISDPRIDTRWLDEVDRRNWVYWPRFRGLLEGVKSWPMHIVDSIDEATDKILRHVPDPKHDQFAGRGLVVGYVQSGKTANYTGLISKAADVGYRFFIVLSGLDKGLRRQTQRRLNAEVVGSTSGTEQGVLELPPRGKRWITLTDSGIDGDFDPGNVDASAIEGYQPVLMVVKKNDKVLERLIKWLNALPYDVKAQTPAMIVDDEADQASVDTKGSDRSHAESTGAPSTINSLIRDVANVFNKSSYVAYTATPYANILIRHDRFDPVYKMDLYPKDFMIVLPKPPGYFGASDLFGLNDENESGKDFVRLVTEEESDHLEAGKEAPGSLQKAIISFVLSVAERMRRGDSEKPMAMLVHTSRGKADHSDIESLIRREIESLENDWLYMGASSARASFEEIWNSDIRRVSHEAGIQLPEFPQIEDLITQAFDEIIARVINSESGEILDYEQEPSLKVIAIGGDKLARGLTIEGLMVSYFVRKSEQYDSLMQMGRWFGFRPGYEDLVRIYTTSGIQSHFCHLASVENQLRQDIEIYEKQGLTPTDVGMRILSHPSLRVTSPQKAREADLRRHKEDFRATLQQTFRFPLNDQERLLSLCDSSWESLGKLISEIPGHPEAADRLVWNGVKPNQILDFLEAWDADDLDLGLNLGLIREYIKLCVTDGELEEWTLAVLGRKEASERLGITKIPRVGRNVNLISRTRLLSDPESLGVVTSPGDELIGLTSRQIEQADQMVANGEFSTRNVAGRYLRDANHGVINVYPISRFSKPAPSSRSRIPLFENPETAPDLLAVAISFPNSDKERPVEEYLYGTVGGFEGV